MCDEFISVQTTPLLVQPNLTPTHPAVAHPATPRCLPSSTLSTRTSPYLPNPYSTTAHRIPPNLSVCHNKPYLTVPILDLPKPPPLASPQCLPSLEEPVFFYIYDSSSPPSVFKLVFGRTTLNSFSESQTIQKTTPYRQNTMTCCNM